MFYLVRFSLVYCLITTLFNWRFESGISQIVDLVFGVLIFLYYLTLTSNVFYLAPFSILRLRFLILVLFGIGGIILKLKFVKFVLSFLLVIASLLIAKEFLLLSNLFVLKTFCMLIDLVTRRLSAI